MNEAINYLSIICVLLISFRCYLVDYQKGLTVTLFFLILLPESMCIHPSITLPAFTIHRLLLLLTFFRFLSQKKIRKKMTRIPLLGVFMGMTGAYFVSTCLSGHLLVSMKRFLYFFTETCLLFYIFQQSIEDRTALLKMVRAIGLSLLCVSILGLLERYAGLEIKTFLPHKLGYDFNPLSGHRHVGSSDIESTYNHRILFGVACAICLWKFLLISSVTESTSRRIARYGSCFLAGSALYFSQSRGPWFAFVASALFLTSIFPARLLGKLTVIVLLVFVVVIANYNVLISLRSLVSSTFDPLSPKGASYNWRYLVWQKAYNEMLQAGPLHFMFGFGGGSHVFMEFGELELPSGRRVRLQSWDCDYAIILFERGIVGFVLVLILYILSLTYSAKYILYNYHNSNHMLFMFASITTILFARASVAIYAAQLVYLEAFTLAAISKMTRWESLRMRGRSLSGRASPGLPA